MVIIILSILLAIFAGVAKAARDRVSSSGECSISIFPIRLAKDVAWKTKGHTMWDRTMGVIFDKGWHMLDFSQLLLWGYSSHLCSNPLLILAYLALQLFFFQIFYAWFFVKPQFRKSII